MKKFINKNNNWLPIIILTFATFIFNTTEYLPIALLSDIANDFNVKESYIGSIITIYAWVVAFIALPLMIFTEKIERKKLYIIIFTLFVLSHILSFYSWNYISLLISRLGIACCHAIYWSITAPIAVRLAPLGCKAKALGLISAGTSVAMIVGLPIGKLISFYLNWRIAFLLIAIISILIIIVLIMVLPKLPSVNDNTIKNLPTIFKNRTLQIIFIIIALYVTADNTLYSYIEPFINQLSNLGSNFIILILSVLGFSAILGAYLFSRYNYKFPFTLLIVSLIFCCLLFILYYPLCKNFIAMVIINLIWGVVATIISMQLLSKTIIESKELSDAGTALYSSLFNVGIGAGSLIGGLIIDNLGIKYIGYISAILLFLSILITLIFKKYLGQRLDEQSYNN